MPSLYRKEIRINTLNEKAINFESMALEQMDFCLSFCAVYADHIDGLPYARQSC